MSARNFVFLSYFFSLFVWAGEAQNYRLSLENQAELNKTIRQNIQILTNKESSATQSLRKIESKIHHNLKIIERLNQVIKPLEQKHRKLREDLVRINRKIQETKQQMVSQIRFSHQNNQKNIAKTIFQQKDRARVNQLSAWYQYVLHNRIRTIDKLSIKIRRQTVLRENLMDRQQLVSVEIEREKLKIKRLNVYQKSSQNKLISIRRSLKSDLTALKQGESDYEALQFMLDKITGTFRKLDISGAGVVPFRRSKGRLQYPNKAKYANSGKSLIFRAKENSQVKAVYSGRVIFSDWMRGYGLLTIIDHGDDYMSLYGRNKILYKDRGEWVSSGEILAKVGNTGGIVGNGLFFELRYKNKPIRANHWFKRS